MTLKTKKLGNNGEDIAADYLKSIGYEILNRNLHLKYGEIDIIARDRDYVVIVEVKTKSNFSQGTPEEMVNNPKKRKLLLLSRSISQNYPDKSVRIDVIGVDTREEKPVINHIINAIEGD